MEDKNQKRPRLDRRLSAIASMVNREGTPGVRLADIGADHGYLVTWLALEGKIAKGYACDVNEQPLERSKNTVELYGAQNLVELRLSDGLHALTPDMVDWVVIAGMGGDLIARILEEAAWEKESHIQYLLQPNTKADHLRRWLLDHGYRTLSERAVEEGRFVYPILHVCPGRMEVSVQPLSLYLAVGLVGSENRTLTGEERKYLERRRDAVQLQLHGIQRGKTEGQESQLVQLAEVISGIDRLLEKKKADSAGKES